MHVLGGYGTRFWAAGEPAELVAVFFGLALW